jgi:hypothetical protein
MKTVQIYACIAWNQIWMRSSQMNPGTMIGGEATSTATDIETDA